VDDGPFVHRRLLRGSVGLLGEDRAESIEASLPGRPPLLDPAARDRQRAAVDLAGPDAADLLGPDEPARLEDGDVLEDGRQRHRERLRQLAHRHRPAAEPLDDRAPGRVGEGLEDEIQLRLRVKHLL